MSLEAVTTSASPYVTQLGDFIVRNWSAFKNAAVQYGTKVYETELVQKIITTASPYFQAAVGAIPNWAKFTWSTGTAVVAVLLTIFSLFIIGRFGPTAPKSSH